MRLGKHAVIAAARIATRPSKSRAAIVYTSATDAVPSSTCTRPMRSGSCAERPRWIAAQTIPASQPGYPTGWNAVARVESRRW